MDTRRLEGLPVEEPVLRMLLTHADPSVRFLAWTGVLERSLTDPQVGILRRAVARHSEAVQAILSAQYPAGYWMHPGLGISPRYRATAWQVLFLAQLGVGRIPQVEHAVRFLVTHNLDDQGAFCFRRGRDGRSMSLTASLLWALGRLGFAGDARFEATWQWVLSEISATLPAPDALVWIARAAVVWRRQDILLCLSDSSLEEAIFTPLSLPTSLTFPLVHRPDALAALEMVVEAGVKLTPRIREWQDWLLSKRNADGAWPLEHIPGRLWWNPGKPGVSNPWVTVRALKVWQALSS